MRAGIQVHESASLRELAAAVVNQAVRDLTAKNKPFEKKLEALLWLTDEAGDFEIWTDWAGTPFLNPYKLLPHLDEAKRRLQRRITNE